MTVHAVAEKPGYRVKPKAGSDHPNKSASDWERDARVRLPHDHLVGKFALTLVEFRRLTA